MKKRKIKMRTFEEKVNYNKKRYKTDNFSAGYVIGVQMYHDYPKYDEKGKAEARKIIGDFNDLAKGIMCGIRDSANERKHKK